MSSPGASVRPIRYAKRNAVTNIRKKSKVAAEERAKKRKERRKKSQGRKRKRKDSDSDSDKNSDKDSDGSTGASQDESDAQSDSQDDTGRWSASDSEPDDSDDSESEINAAKNSKREREQDIQDDHDAEMDEVAEEVFDSVVPVESLIGPSLNKIKTEPSDDGDGNDLSSDDGKSTMPSTIVTPTTPTMPDQPKRKVGRPRKKARVEEDKAASNKDTTNAADQDTTHADKEEAKTKPIDDADDDEIEVISSTVGQPIIVSDPTLVKTDPDTDPPLTLDQEPISAADKYLRRRTIPDQTAMDTAMDTDTEMQGNSTSHSQIPSSSSTSSTAMPGSLSSTRATSFTTTSTTTDKINYRPTNWDVTKAQRFVECLNKQQEAHKAYVTSIFSCGPQMTKSDPAMVKAEKLKHAYSLASQAVFEAMPKKAKELQNRLDKAHERKSKLLREGKRVGDSDVEQVSALLRTLETEMNRCKTQLKSLVVKETEQEQEEKRARNKLKRPSKTKPINDGTCTFTKQEQEFKHLSNSQCFTKLTEEFGMEQSVVRNMTRIQRIQQIAKLVHSPLPSNKPKHSKQAAAADPAKDKKRDKIKVKKRDKIKVKDEIKDKKRDEIKVKTEIKDKKRDEIKVKTEIKKSAQVKDKSDVQVKTEKDRDVLPIIKSESEDESWKLADGTEIRIVNIRSGEGQVGPKTKYKTLLDWTKAPGHIYCGRASPFVKMYKDSDYCNPIEINKKAADPDAERERVCDAFVPHCQRLKLGAKLLAEIRQLQHRHPTLGIILLGCWCLPLRCHTKTLACEAVAADQDKIAGDQ